MNNDGRSLGLQITTRPAEGHNHAGPVRPTHFSFSYRMPAGKVLSFWGRTMDDWNLQGRRMHLIPLKQQLVWRLAAYKPYRPVARRRRPGGTTQHCSSRRKAAPQNQGTHSVSSSIMPANLGDEHVTARARPWDYYVRAPRATDKAFLAVYCRVDRA